MDLVNGVYSMVFICFLAQLKHLGMKIINILSHQAHFLAFSHKFLKDLIEGSMSAVWLGFDLEMVEIFKPFPSSFGVGLIKFAS